MAQVKIVPNSEVIGEYLKGEHGVREMVENDHGRPIQEAAGDGFEMETTVGRNRMRVVIRTATFEAILAESVDHALTSALDAGR